MTAQITHDSPGHTPDTGQYKEKVKTGLWEGVRLIMSRHYVLGILVISAFPEIAFSIISFRMKLQVIGVIRVIRVFRVISG